MCLLILHAPDILSPQSICKSLVSEIHSCMFTPMSGMGSPILGQVNILSVFTHCLLVLFLPSCSPVLLFEYTLPYFPSEGFLLLNVTLCSLFYLPLRLRNPPPSRVWPFLRLCACTFEFGGPRSVTGSVHHLSVWAPFLALMQHFSLYRSYSWILKQTDILCLAPAYRLVKYPSHINYRTTS